MVEPERDIILGIIAIIIIISTIGAGYLEMRGALEARLSGVWPRPGSRDLLARLGQGRRQQFGKAQAGSASRWLFSATGRPERVRVSSGQQGGTAKRIVTC